MKILSIETSCDETAISLLEITGELNRPEIKVLANSLISQVPIHEKYGGVFPTLAKREHQKNLPILLEKTLEEAKESFESPDIDYIAVTTGPGLEPALWTGITFVEELSQRWGKPIVPVNHMEGHIYSVLYNLPENLRLELPALALLVSGGHTELVYIKDFGVYEILGRTLDDAAGEAFDKVARILGLSYPGGPKISELAEKSRQRKNELDFTLPRPMLHSKDLNFSFSGLKTAVLYKVRAEEVITEEYKEDMARAFEDAAVDVLVAKTRNALIGLSGEAQTLIVGGGVSANTQLSLQLRKLATEFPGLNAYFPNQLLTTDNAIMIGIASYIRVSRDPELLKRDIKLEADGNLELTS